MTLYGGSDVANAVLDGADAVMLSGETANGSFPKSAVEIMARSCFEAEKMLADNDTSGYDEIFKLMKQVKKQKASKGTSITAAESAASSAVKTASDLSAKAIIVLSETGETARLLAKFHPNAPIIAVCTAGWVARQIEGYLCNATAIETKVQRGDGRHVRVAYEYGKEKGIFVDGDAVVCVHTMRNADNIKEWTMRVQTVLSNTNPPPKNYGLTE